jgi:hypothetical protein
MQVLRTVPRFTKFTWRCDYTPFFSMPFLSEGRYGIGIDYYEYKIEIGVHSLANLDFIEKAHALIREVLDVSNPVKADTGDGGK